MVVLRVLSTFTQYLRPYRAQVALLIGGLLVDVAFNALMPFLFKVVIDDAIPNHDRDLLWRIVAIMAVAVLVAGLVAIGRDYLYARLGAKVVADLRLRMFEHLQRLSADYYGRAEVGDIMARFTTDTAAVNTGVVSALPETVLGVLGIVIYTVVLVVLEPALALIAIIGFPALLVGPRILSPRAERESVRVLDAEASTASRVQENVMTQSVVRAFGLTASQLDSFKSKLDDLYRASLRFNVLSYLAERTPNVTFLGLQVLILAVGAIRAFNGDVEIGTLVAFNSIVLSLSVSITGLTRILPPLLTASGGIDRIHRLLDETPAVVDRPGAKPMPPFEHAIQFQHVSFSYDGERKQLNDVSFTIERGVKAAFVGTSGSGKSTVLSLIMRFFDPQAGAVSIDGTDIRDLTQTSLRDQQGVVLQESLLFNTSIRENIRMGRLDSTDEEIEAAARAAEIEAVIHQQPQGYDTVIGERGGRLSGGQRQRIAIARAVVREPAILILDEATSALDPGTEAAIGATIDRLAANRTVVSVTHRLASVVGYDRICVMDSGHLVEQGTHEDLLAQGGQYARLWEKQSGVAVTADGSAATVTERYLRSIPVLAGLPEEAYPRLSKLFATEHFPEGRVVIYEGDRMADKFYIVARGRLAVTKGAEGTDQQQVAIREDGDYFGEIALLKDVPRTATVTAISPSVLLTLRRPEFLELLRSQPGIEQEINRIIPERISELERLSREGSNR